LLFGDEKPAGILDKVKDACILKPYRQKGIEGGCDYRKQDAKLCERENRDKTANADDADIPELP